MFSSVLMTAFYTISGPFATLRLSGDNDLRLSLTAIHVLMAELPGEDESFAYVEVHEFVGNSASPKMECQDGDTLIILAKRDGAVVGSQVFEVDMMAVDQGYLLIPRGGFNVLCEQEEQLRPCDLDEMIVEYPRLQASVVG